jgi:outer membrane lipoprotein-sorting protein
MKLLKALFLLIALPVFPVAAEESSVQFSADTVTSAPQRGEQNGKLYVGDGMTRTEMDMNGNTLIQIIDLNSLTAYMINTEQKTYIQRKATPASMPADAASQASPCTGMPGVTCKKVGEEKIGQRQTVKWELVNPSAGDGESLYYWIDKERNIPLRQIMPDGSRLEMQLEGTENVNGRTTEKWKLTASRPGSEDQLTWQWYDPELKMNIREEQPGGMLREIRNIKVAPQPATLFTVPEDYQELSGQQGSMNGEGGR